MMGRQRGEFQSTLDDLYQRRRLTIIAGPCVAESYDVCYEVASVLKAACDKHDVGYIFKASFDKANRTSHKNHRGSGLQHGLNLLEKIRTKLAVPVLTDIHLPEQARACAEVVDVLQIPAFLCRQTDLLLAAAEADCAINVKKGQFLAPDDMVHVVEKLKAFGADKIAVTERGTTFGYHNLVVDMRGLVSMAKSCKTPIIFDATHSVQQPGGLEGRSGGDRHMAPPLARAAVATGIDGLFCEVHPDPDNALSDGPNSLTLPMAERLVFEVAELHRLRLRLEKF